MEINNLPGVHNLQTQRIDNEEKNTPAQPPTPQPAVAETRADLSMQGQAMAQRERDIASRFDVKNLTPDQFESMTAELEADGLISELEASDLRALFQEGQQSLQSLNQSGEQPVNMLALLEQQAEQSSGPESRANGLFAMFDAMDMQNG